jgi:phospholipase/carboxylesterase
VAADAGAGVEAEGAVKKTLAALLGLSACATARPELTENGVSFVQLFTGGGDATSPLIVSIHGRSNSPEGFASNWDGFPGKAEIMLPRGTLKQLFGYQWWEWDSGLEDAELGARVAKAEEFLWPAIEAHAKGRPIIVMGMSMGGVITFAMAARHPDRIKLAIPISGALPKSLLPKPGAPVAPVHALHGTADRTLPIKWDRETITFFPGAKLDEFEGAGHEITPAMRDQVWALVSGALKP